MACGGIQVINPLCQMKAAANEVVGSAIGNLANAALEAAGQVVASLGTMWVHIGTPNLTGEGGSGTATVALDPNVVTIMNYVMWVSLAIAIVSLFVLGSAIATKVRAGEGAMAVGKVGVILGAVVFITASSALVAAILPKRPQGVSGAVEFIQAQLWWYMGAMAVVSVILGGARMAWEQRAEPGKDVLKSLLTLVVVAGAGVTVTGLLISASDSLAVTIINNSVDCNVGTDAACFGQNISTLLALTAMSGGPGVTLGSLLIIILCLVALVASLAQIVLMIARGGMLVILAGILPLAASFTNTEMGRGWFKKCIAWTVALILYKPAAAIVYAAAFQLVGTQTFGDDGSGILSVLTGLMLMMIALVAMPALMRFVTPMVGSLAAGGGGAALAMGGLAMLPSGAAQLGRLASGSDGGGEPGGSGSSGAAGSPGAAQEGAPGEGPTGGTETAGDQGAGEQPAVQPTGGQAGTGGGEQGPAGAEGGESTETGVPTGGTPGGGMPGGGGGTPMAGAEGGATAAGAEGGAAAAGGGAAASGAAAAGPWGAAAAAAVQAGQATAGAVEDLGEEATGEGPNGSN